MKTSLLTSRLKKRVTLQEPTLTADGQGGYTRGWADVATVWAEIRPVERLTTQTERFRDGRLQPEITHRISIRYRSGVHTGMRLQYGTRLMAIRSVLSPEEEKKTLVILAVEGEDI